MSIADKFEVIADAVYEAGKKSQYDLFWDNFQREGQRKSYEYAFLKWDEKAFYPKYNITIGITGDAGAGDSGASTSAFRNFHSNRVNGQELNKPIDLVQRLEDCGVQLETSKCKNFGYIFSFANFSRIPAIDVTSTTALGYMMFYYASNLETIDKIILKDDGSQTCGTNVFQGCTKLKNIAFEGVIGKSFDFKDCSLLTKESIKSIVNHLSDTQGATLSLSKKAVNNAFGINVDAPETYPEGSEYYVLRNSKSNWTFNYA